MRLWNLIGRWKKKRNLEADEADFSKACKVVGGESALPALFTKLGAHTVSQQAAVCANLAAGVKPSELKGRPDRGFTTSQLEAGKTKLAALLGGKPQLLAYLKAHRAFHVSKQWEFVSAELARRGASITPASKPAMAPPPKPTTLPTARREGPRFTGTAATSFSPAVRTAPAASAPIMEGRIDVATARERTREIFGHAPAVIDQSERVQWNELTAMYRSHGHGAPWDEDTSPEACYMGIHQKDAAWRTREARIAKAFPGVQPTTARIVPKKVEPAKPLHGRARAVAAMKIPK